MALTTEEAKALCTRIRLGGHDGQEEAVTAAVSRLLVDGCRGIVLADQVGFGKTYEALAIMALLCEQARVSRKTFNKVLILCRSSLLGKCQEELSGTKAGKGFPQYIEGENWHKRHPIHTLLRNVRKISHRAAAEEHRGIREDGKVQAPAGIYIVNQEVLSEKNRRSRPFLKHLFRTEWDLIIVDEAHHYGRWTTPAFLFAPDRNMRNYDQGISEGNFGKILALTATPFELTPNEMVQLLAMIRADKDDLVCIEKGLDLYVRRLEYFFSLRDRSPSDAHRQQAVETLNILRDKDAEGCGQNNVGLEFLLRKYLIRNTKSKNERRYFFVNRQNGSYSNDPFTKLDDLRARIKQAPLLPFDGPDALFYLTLRELIDETLEQSRSGEGKQTFITTDLRQGLSSYPQILESSLLKRNLESAHRLQHLLKAWNQPVKGRFHPKVASLADIVSNITASEIEKVRKNSTKWFSKIIVFNKLIRGTAPHLRKVLEDRITPLFEQFLSDILTQKNWGTQAEFSRLLRQAIAGNSITAEKKLTDSFPGFCLIPNSFTDKHFIKYRGKHLLAVFKEPLLLHAEQPLFMIRAALHAQSNTPDSLTEWTAKELIDPLTDSLEHIIDSYLDDSPDEDRPRDELEEMAQQECMMRREEYQSVGLIGRFDGENAADREAHRRNFNDLFNPFVLLVSRVGEEGIDLQNQCRYIIHYDLEWNPAKMEQREGRVDRVGWGRADEGFIDVRFLLLKGTYEERIFHTVMQRDQWFQVLIGSKKKEMGTIDSEGLLSSGDIDEGGISENETAGSLSEEEMQKIMIDLRPGSI